MDGLREVRVDCPEQGVVKLMWPIPRRGDPWGVLAPLKGTAWEPLIRVVSGDVVSHALHGWATPLMRVIGPSPRHVPRLLSEESGRCSMFRTCVAAGVNCRPGHPKLPDCYEAPGLDGRGPLLASRVALAWREGFYVLVVEGAEFNLR